MPFMLEVEGFILTGGASSRMGTDKAALHLGEQTFVELIAHALHSIAPNVSLVSARADADKFKLPIIKDIHRDCGALGGLHAALYHGRAEWAAIVSCDLPFVTGELFKRLASFVNHEIDAIAPLQQDGRPQPLCTLYRRAICLKISEQLIQSRELRLRILLQQVKTRWVKFDELADLKASALFFSNINTPEDYKQARQVERIQNSEVRSQESEYRTQNRG